LYKIIWIPRISMRLIRRFWRIRRDRGTEKKKRREKGRTGGAPCVRGERMAVSVEKREEEKAVKTQGMLDNLSLK